MSELRVEAASPTRIWNRLSKDSWLALGLFVLLAIVSGISLYQQTSEPTLPPLTGHSTQPDGAKALWLWLEALDYEVTDQVAATFAIPEGSDIMLLLQPTTFVDESEWPLIDEWIEAGGTLLLAGTNFYTEQALAHFDFGLDLRSLPVSEVEQQTPLMASPPAVALPVADNLLTLQTERDDYVTHFAVGMAPVVVSVGQGNGRIILTTLTDPFTNTGLREAGYPELVLNLISAAGATKTVWFDEWHHGVRVQADEIAGFGAWLQRTPLGRSFLLIAVVVFVAIVLQGRPFGRPVPLPQATTRRAPLEYITALANLSRRAGHRTAVMQDYRHRLKKSIGHRYRLDPTLPDAQFLAQLAEYNSNLDITALRSLLQRLSAANIGEGEMVQLAAEVAEWLQ
ncbi:MAG: DUF4350 domain-containing protein [Ardenticatenaceae bacterium]|nr:DUF4350 domain-containing protein [Ardenticatenaceae bacterium]